MIIDLDTLSANQRYFALIQSIIPRPVAWVLSENPDTGYNLAPFSYFSAVSSDPPLIMLSIGKKPDGSGKDTRVNIIERQQFVVHIAHRELAEHVTETSRTRAHGESELSALGLATSPIDGFRLPRLSDCRIALACDLYRAEDITETQVMILGRIQSLYIDDQVATLDDKGRLSIDAAAVDPIARLGGNDYVEFGDVFTVARPK